MNKKIKIVLVLFFFLSIFTYYHYYFYQDHTSVPQWRMEVSESGFSGVLSPEDIPVRESFGVGLFDRPQYFGGAVKTRVFRVNGTFEKYLFIANAINSSNEYLVFVLVDYIQVPFYADGKLNLTHMVRLGPMEYRFLKIRIENLSEGYHDVFIGVFLDPYNHNLSDKYRLSTDFSMMGGVRIQVISGRPLYKMPTFNKPPIVCKNVKNDTIGGLLVTKTPCSNIAWLRENVSGSIKYYINLGNRERNIQTFALVAMLNYKQVPINNDTFVYYGYLYRNQEISIPGELRIPEAETLGRIQEFIVLYFTEPFLPLQFPPDIRNINLEARAEPSIRIAILPNR